MKTAKWITTAALALSLGALTLQAAQDDAPPGPPPRDGGGDSQSGGHHRPPPLPIVEALDTNHDGVIDSNEIAAASESLKKLDKNHDGKLTRDEFLPPRPSGHGEGSDHRPPPPPSDDK